MTDHPAEPLHTANDATQAQYALNELSLEREKVQIERERLALERERWAAERETYRATQKLNDRAAGRLTIGISTFTLSLLCALLAGGAIGAWLVAGHQQSSNRQVAESLIQALGSDTNAYPDAESASPLLRALGRRQGRPNGYLLILD